MPLKCHKCPYCVFFILIMLSWIIYCRISSSQTLLNISFRVYLLAVCSHIKNRNIKFKHLEDIPRNACLREQFTKRWSWNKSVKPDGRHLVGEAKDCDSDEYKCKLRTNALDLLIALQLLPAKEMNIKNTTDLWCVGVDSAQLLCPFYSVFMLS